jgi:hypothetical protein
MKIPAIAICRPIFAAFIMLTLSTLHAQSGEDKVFLAEAAQSDVNEIKLSQLAEQRESGGQGLRPEDAGRAQPNQYEYAPVCRGLAD